MLLPRLLNYIVAIYLIIAGIKGLGLFHEANSFISISPLIGLQVK
ncbi:DUF3096 domain-containing protein [Legionella parisiensis]|nr:DUF3096 domain-containing protein [Legionella parisiensis]